MLKLDGFFVWPNALLARVCYCGYGRRTLIPTAYAAGFKTRSGMLPTQLALICFLHTQTSVNWISWKSGWPSLLTKQLSLIRDICKLAQIIQIPNLKILGKLVFKLICLGFLFQRKLAEITRYPVVLLIQIA